MFGSEKKYKLSQYEFVCEMLGISGDATCGQTLIEKVVEVENNANSAQQISKELIDTYDEYIKLLGEELNELIPFATQHGWKSTRYEAGKMLRDKISSIRKNIL